MEGMLTTPGMAPPTLSPNNTSCSEIREGKARVKIVEGDPPMYQCCFCRKKFKTKAHIKYHEFCSGDVEKPIKCERCGQGFIIKSHFDYHMRTHTGERPFVCPKCGKGFNQKAGMERHLRCHTGEKRFTCKECNRGFSTSNGLRSHELTHNSSNTTTSQTLQC